MYIGGKENGTEVPMYSSVTVLIITFNFTHKIIKDPDIFPMIKRSKKGLKTLIKSYTGGPKGNAPYKQRKAHFQNFEIRCNTFTIFFKN